MQQLKIHPKYLLSSPKITVHNQTQIAKEEEEEKKKEEREESKARSGKIEIRKRRRKGVYVQRKMEKEC